MTVGPLILGATGQIGRAFRAGAADLFPAHPVWQARAPLDGHLTWDILNEPAPDLVCNGILSLAGGVTDPQEVHVELAKAAARLGKALRVPVLIASSQAVYGVQDGPMTERKPCHPSSPYGQAKYAMEQAVADDPNVTCLRIGNVPGADMLFRSARSGPVLLDQWPDGQGPVRSMIGLRTLALVCARLIKIERRPPVLNVAQPGQVSMESLLNAAGVAWQWTRAPDRAVANIELDVTELGGLMPLDPANPTEMIAQGRACGVIP